MSDLMIFEEEVGADGTVVLHLPPGKRVQIVVKDLTPLPQPELSPEEEAALDAELKELLKPENLRGQGLTMGEIARSPEFGILADENIPDGTAYIEQQRRARSKRLKW